MSILVIAEHDNTSIRPSTLNTIAAAKLLGDDIHLFVATNNSELPNSASTIESISKVISSVDDTLEHQLPEALAPMIKDCLLYTSPSPRDKRQSRMPSSA